MKTKISLIRPGDEFNPSLHVPPVATIGGPIGSRNGSRYGAGLHDSTTGVSPVTGRRHE